MMNLKSSLIVAFFWQKLDIVSFQGRLQAYNKKKTKRFVSSAEKKKTT